MDRKQTSAEEVDTRASGNGVDRPRIRIRGWPLERGYSREEARHRRSEIKLSRSSFVRLPAEIIELILYLTDPDTFASLVLLNRRWRAVSETPQLYAHHLSRCPSFSLSNDPISGPFQTDDLPRLRGRFAAEVKRNLFEAYLGPRRTTIKLISTSASSSAAFPGGEAFSFSFSPNGHHVLALSSSRIYLINLDTDTISVKREFKISRRPVSATILDDASILAVLSTDHQVNIYDLRYSKVKHVRSVPLDNPPRTITLSPGAAVLAAAYDGGIEVYSLASLALPTDRRAVKCDAVDSLAFSNDGTMLLGTTQHYSAPNTVIISAPYYTEDGQGASAEDILSQMWTTQILFPSSSRDCSHATLLPHHMEGQANWTFTHDRVFETFRAVRIDDLRNGTTYFTGPKWTGRTGPLLPRTLPAANERGELIAAGFLGNELWLYGVPEALDFNVHRAQCNGPNTGRVIGPSDADAPVIGPGASTAPLPPWTQAEQSERRPRLPQWQVLVDKYRNLFVKGRQVATMEGLSAMAWVARKGQEENSCRGERLVAVAPGGVSTSPEDGSEEPMPVDGGRILILDFERGTRHGESRAITIELGDREPETLEEESRDLETEVAIFRRRTVAMGRGGLAGSRSKEASIESAQRSPRRNSLIAPVIAPGHQGVPDSRTPVMQSVPNPDAQATASTSEDTLSIEEVQEALDGPYSHNSPRSRLTLYRASTAAATSRRHYPQSTHSTGRVEYRRADGRREVPHESDADNWVPPPPPYTRDPEHPLPQHLQMTLLSHQTESLTRSDRVSGQTSSVGTNLESTTHDAVPDTGSLAERGEDMSGLRRPRIRRGVTEPNAGFEQEFYQSSQQSEPLRRPVSSLVAPRAEGLLTTSSTTTSQHNTIRRRPLSAYAGLLANSPGPHRARLTSPISPIPEPLGLERRRSVSTPFSSRHPGPSWTPLMASTGPPPTMDLPQLTLSGPNLQQRLHYPVPPTPTGPQLEISPPSTPSPSQEQQTLPLTPSPAPGVESRAPVLPSAEQLANLQNRYSHGQTRIVPRPVSAVFRHNHAQPVHTPPRAALGATSRSTSPSGDRTLAPARALSRSNSRGSTRSVSARKPQSQRPDYRRLDTIQSVASYISHRSHSRSASRELATAGIPKRVPSRAERSAALNVQAAKRSGRIGRRKGKKGDGRNGEGSQAQEWTDVEGHVEHTSEVKKKGSKCIVM